MRSSTVGMVTFWRHDIVFFFLHEASSRSQQPRYEPYIVIEQVLDHTNGDYYKPLEIRG